MTLAHAMIASAWKLRNRNVQKGVFPIPGINIHAADANAIHNIRPTLTSTNVRNKNWLMIWRPANVLHAILTRITRIFGVQTA